jgi:predicted phage tail protein
MLLVLPTYGKYRFKVRAVKMDGSSGPWSEYTNIFYNLNNVIRIGVPTSLTYQFDYATKTVNISWQNVSDVSKYQFKIDCYSCGDQIGWNVFMDSSVDQATFLAADASRTMTKIKILENKDYRFKVRALDDFGNFGDWITDYLYFTYVKQ